MTFRAIECAVPDACDRITSNAERGWDVNRTAGSGVFGDGDITAINRVGEISILEC